ncbi:MAG: hypothetical protein H7838_00605 [Magnetococcus sp. DMHC-8]
MAMRFLVLLLMLMARPAQAWTELPLLLHGGGDRTRALFKTQQMGTPSVEIFSPFFAPHPAPAAGHWQLEADPATGITVIPRPQQGGYHWLQARQEQQNQVTVASTVHYFSDPAPAPRTMLQYAKTELEIIPMPLPREFARYRAGERWPFLLRFHNQPLAHAPLHFHTEQGDPTLLVSDAHGMVHLRLPDSLPAPSPGPADQAAKPGHARHGPPVARFALVADHLADGKLYRTTFSQGYAPDPYTGKSLATGAGFALLGMLCATPLLRRSKPTSRHP